MIKEFKMQDLGYFIPNKFSNPDHVLDQLTDANYKAQTMWADDGMVAAILCFRNYWGRCWLGFFLIAEDFPPKMGVALRKHIRETMDHYDALRLQTHSVDCDELTKWHEFLGFKWEGLHEKMLYDKDYSSWALMRGGQ